MRKLPSPTRSRSENSNSLSAQFDAAHRPSQERWQRWSGRIRFGFCNSHSFRVGFFRSLRSGLYKLSAAPGVDPRAIDTPPRPPLCSHSPDMLTARRPPRFWISLERITSSEAEVAATRLITTAVRSSRCLVPSEKADTALYSSAMISSGVR